MRTNLCILSTVLCVAIQAHGDGPELSIMHGHLVGFQTETNLFYRLESAISPATNSWDHIESIAGTGDMISRIFTEHQAHRVYRVVEYAPPIAMASPGILFETPNFRAITWKDRTLIGNYWLWSVEHAPPYTFIPYPETNANLLIHEDVYGVDVDLQFSTPTSGVSIFNHEVPPSTNDFTLVDMTGGEDHTPPWLEPGYVFSIFLDSGDITLRILDPVLGDFDGPIGDGFALYEYLREGHGIATLHIDNMLQLLDHMLVFSSPTNGVLVQTRRMKSGYLPPSILDYHAEFGTFSLTKPLEFNGTPPAQFAYGDRLFFDNGTNTARIRFTADSLAECSFPSTNGTFLYTTTLYSNHACLQIKSGAESDTLVALGFLTDTNGVASNFLPGDCYFDYLPAWECPAPGSAPKPGKSYVCSFPDEGFSCRFLFTSGTDITYTEAGVPGSQSATFTYTKFNDHWAELDVEAPTIGRPKCRMEFNHQSATSGQCILFESGGIPDHGIFIIHELP